MNKPDKSAERRLENPDFLEHLYRQVWLRNGAEKDHADAVARAVSFGDRFGKINQGAPFDICYQVMENEFRGRVSLQINLLDIKFD